MVMELDQNGLDLIKNFEELRLEAYTDSVGVETIGYGMIRYPKTGKPVQKGDTITAEQAEAMFLATLKPYEDTVNEACPNLPQNKFNACVSLCYNIGQGGFRNSTVRKRINDNPDDPSIREAFLMWDKGNGKVLQGLVNRRTAEANLYFS